jgi:hypothetical protein
MLDVGGWMLETTDNRRQTTDNRQQEIQTTEGKSKEQSAKSQRLTDGLKYRSTDELTNDRRLTTES